MQLAFGCRTKRLS